MRRYLFTLLLLMLLILTSCGPIVTAVKPKGQVVQDFYFEYPYNDSWQALLSALGDLNLQIDTIDKESGVVTTSKQRTTKYEMAKISYYQNDRVYGVFDYCEYKITIYMRSQKDKTTKIKIVPYYEGIFIDSEGALKPRVLKSNGILEGRINNRIIELLSN